MDTMNNDLIDSEITILPDDVAIQIFEEHDKSELIDLDYVTCRIEEIGGQKLGVAKIQRDVYIAQVAWALAYRCNKPIDTLYGIHHKESGRLLQSSETLLTAKVKDGHTLRLLPNIPVYLETTDGQERDFRNSQFVDAVLTNRIEKPNHSLVCLRFDSILDIPTPKFFGGYYLNAVLKGRDFSMMQPCAELRPSLCLKLGNLYDLYVDKVGMRLDTGDYTVRIKTINRFESYSYLQPIKAFQIGKLFEILPNQFPCFLFYENLASTEYLIFDLKLLSANSWLLYKLATTILVEEDWRSIHAMDEVMNAMEDWMRKSELSPRPLKRQNMNTTIIEAMAATIDLLDQP
jgi:hypothetical protein